MYSGWAAQYGNLPEQSRAVYFHLTTCRWHHRAKFVTPFRTSPAYNSRLLHRYIITSFI